VRTSRLLLQLLLPVTLVFGLLGLLHRYLWLRLVEEPGLQGLAWTAGTWLAVGGVVALPVAMVAGRLLPRRWGAPFALVGFLWMGAFSFLLVGTAVLDLLRWAGAPLSSAGHATGVLAFAVPSLLWAYRTARGPAVVERVPVSIRGLGQGMAGLKVVQLSDIHVGPTVDRAHLQRMVDQAMAQSPDLVVVTGDLVDGSVAQLRDEVAPLADLCRAPLGAYFVTGNHEYYSGGRAWEAEVARHGLHVLHNAHAVLERSGDRLVLAGVTDLEGGRFSPEDACRPDLAFAGAPEGVPRVLLAHQPRAARLAKTYSVALQLSGHTHGGQFFPWMFFVRLQQPVVQGLSTVDGVPVYTNRGTGYWGPPLRLGPRPEITLLTLSPAPSPR
jgi:predicted MPP superfamily phosphohydrolase